MTLSEFLLARIAEDEAYVINTNCHCGEYEDAWLPDCPSRILAECEAKRRIVEQAVDARRAADRWTVERLKTDTSSPLPEYARADAYAEVLRFLAIPYADHPDHP